MKNSGTCEPDVANRPATDLLAVIRSFQMAVGTNLGDLENTLLLQNHQLPMESGFKFLSYSRGFVMLNVPRQKLAAWYPPEGWIASEKEKIAREIGEKNGFQLCEPPDMPIRWQADAVGHHHIELSDCHEAVLVIHPQYLKIRLFHLADSGSFTRFAQRPVDYAPDLLRDLARLYGSSSCSLSTAEKPVP